MKIYTKFNLTFDDPSNYLELSLETTNKPGKWDTKLVHRCFELHASIRINQRLVGIWKDDACLSPPDG